MDSSEEEIVFIADLVSALRFLSLDASLCQVVEEGRSQREVR
jgi:hypothetical protein